MEFSRRQFWIFVAIVLVSSALIAWSLVSLYGPLGYQEDYLDEEYEPEIDELEDAPSSQDRPAAETPAGSGARASEAQETAR